MKNSWKMLLAGAAVILAGCDSDSSPDSPETLPPAPETFGLQVVHASSNAPEVTVTVNGDSTLTDVDFKDASAELTLPVDDTYDIEVLAELPDGTTTPVISVPGFASDADINTTAIAIGLVGGEGDQALGIKTIARARDAVAGGNARVTVLHGAALAPAVDVYVTAPGADLNAEMPLNEMLGVDALAFGDDALDPAEVPAGSYQIRITVDGAPDLVAFDSGEISLGDGADLVAIAVDNTNAGAGEVPGAGIPIPVSLLVVDSFGASELLDVQTQAEVRVTHAVPDVGAPNDPTQGAVDVYANGGQVTALDDLLYTETRGPLALPEGDYQFQVAPADTTNFVIDSTVTLVPGEFYEAIAIGSVANMDLELFAAPADRRPVATAAKVRLIHGSASAGEVDIYVEPIGTDSVAGLTPVDGLVGIGLGADTGFLELPPGQYQVLVALTGTETVAISAGIDITASGVYTIIARDPVAPSMEFGVLSIDDDPTP
jgi:hypothetical protein